MSWNHTVELPSGNDCAPVATEHLACAKAWHMLNGDAPAAESILQMRGYCTRKICSRLTSAQVTR